MLNFIIGEKGSGKTAAAHRIIGQCAEKGESVMLIVPRQFSFESDKSILSLLGPRLASEIEVLSFKRLCDEGIRRYGTKNKPVATAGVKNILMYLAVDAMNEQLTAFEKHKKDIALSKKMLQSITELKNTGISAEELLSCAEKIDDGILAGKMKETAMIFSAYDTLLSQKFFDEADLLTYMASVLAGTDYFSDRIVVIDGYSDFSFGELKIIEQMLIKAKEVYITLCIRDERDTSDLSPFAVVSRTMRRLKLLAGNNGVAVAETIVTHRRPSERAELDHLDKNIFLPGCKAFEGKCESITVSAAPDLIAECDSVARKIKAMLRREEYRCRDIAVVFRSEDYYEKQIKLSLIKYGVPIFEDKRQPLWNQPLISLVSNLIELSYGTFGSDNIFRYLKTGLTDLDAQDVAEAENYVYAWDIEGERWLKNWTDNPDGFGIEMTEQRRERLSLLNGIRRQITEPLIRFREDTENASGRDCAALIYKFLRDNGIDNALREYALELEKKGMTELALEQEQVWDFLMEALGEIADSLGDTRVPMKKLGELFTLCIQSKTLGKIPDGFDEVTVCPAQRILTKNIRVVFAVGMNEDVFPLRKSETGIFSRRDKVKIALNGIESMNDNDEAVLFERFLAYNTLCCATEELHLSYCLSDAGEKNRTKSEYVEAVESLFPDIREHSVSDESISELIESEQSAFEIMAREWNSDSPEAEALRKYFRGRDEYRGKIESLERATKNKAYAFEDKKKALDFFGRNLYFSASQLDVYGRCPFQYFCKYGLYAKPRLRVSFDAANTGTAIHYVLEKLLSKYKGREFLEISDSALRAEIGELLTGYLESSLSGEENKTARFRYIYYRMQKIVADIMSRLREEFGDSDFEPCDFELEISRDGDVRPFAVALKEGKAEFFGIIDRVDKFDGDGRRYIRVVDYKTGLKDFKLNDAINGMNMQMLLYLVSIWRNGKGFYENITPAGVLYFPARLDTVKTDRELDTESRKRDRYTSLKMKGLLLEDNSLIEHMDKKCEGLFLPVKYDAKKGEFKGNLISLPVLGKLAKHMDGIIRAMGDSLHEGRIPAFPVAGGNHTNTCLYCDYSDVCMVEKPTHRYIYPAAHSNCIDYLKEEYKDEETVD